MSFITASLSLLFIHESSDRKTQEVIVEETSKLTRGETVVDWLGVTKRKANCLVINKANDKKFFELLKNKLSYLP